jgi:hypothetical protein
MYQLKDLFEQKTSNVIGEISPNDSMYVTEEHYFSVGHSALKYIKLAMLAAGNVIETFLIHHVNNFLGTQFFGLVIPKSAHCLPYHLKLQVSRLMEKKAVR